MDKKIIALLLIIAIVLPLLFINFEEEPVANKKPVVEIIYPLSVIGSLSMETKNGTTSGVLIT